MVSAKTAKRVAALAVVAASVGSPARTPIAEPQEALAAPGRKVVLAELFTGTECPPCAAADTGFERILDAFSRDEVVVLQYHLDIPAPDPFSTEDAEARAYYYMADPQATGDQARWSVSLPRAFFDGREGMASGGPRGQGGDFFRRARDIIERVVVVAPTFRLDTRAGLGFEGGRVQVTVRTSRPEGGVDLRLHMVLYRDKLKYRGANGVSQHRYVVTQMLDGPRGARLAEGQSVTVVKRLPREQMQAADTGLVVFVQEAESHQVHDVRLIEFGEHLPDAVAEFNEGARRARSGDFAAAAGHLETAVEIDPNSARAQGTLGAVHARLGRSEQACVAFERALELDPRLATLHWNLAQLYATRQLAPEAIGHLEAFLAEEPSDERAGEARALLRKLRQ